MKMLLSTHPEAVYELAQARKQSSKNHWARDDPTYFAALQALFLVAASITYAVSFRVRATTFIFFVLVSVLWNWLALGIIVATMSREIANRLLVVTNNEEEEDPSGSEDDREQVEWLYAFDIHCNSFFPSSVVLCKLKEGIDTFF